MIRRDDQIRVATGRGSVERIIRHHVATIPGNRRLETASILNDVALDATEHALLVVCFKVELQIRNIAATLVPEGKETFDQNYAGWPDRMRCFATFVWTCPRRWFDNRLTGAQARQRLVECAPVNRVRMVRRADYLPLFV